MYKNFSTIEDLFLYVLDSFIFSKENNKLKYSLKEEKIVKNIYEKLSNNFIFYGDLSKTSLSSKQFNLICNFIKNNKDLLTEKIISEENFSRLMTEKNTKLNIYESIKKFHYADIVSGNLLGLYFPNSKYLKHETKKIFNDNTIYDEELNISLIEINKNNIYDIINFLKEHRFEVSKKLEETLKYYSSLINKSSIKIDQDNENLKLTTINLNPIFVKILHVLEITDDS